MVCYSFHAWQSSLLFTAMFIVHLIFSWTRVISWILFVVNILLIGFLSLQAYRDGTSAVIFLAAHTNSSKPILLTDLRFPSLADWPALLLMLSERPHT